jgi:hypothetical protein
MILIIVLQTINVRKNNIKTMQSYGSAAIVGQMYWFILIGPNIPS